MWKYLKTHFLFLFSPSVHLKVKVFNGMYDVIEKTASGYSVKNKPVYFPSVSHVGVIIGKNPESFPNIAL